jgi:hypothetical protein
MIRFSRPVVVLCIVGYVAGASLYPAIPQPYCGNGCDISIARPLIAFLLPTAALLLRILLGALWSRDPLRDRDERADRVYHAILLRIELLILGLHIAVLTAFAIGLRPDVMRVLARLVPLMFGMAVVGIGNLLPRLRPNLVMGIRTRQTLSDRDTWMTTHRIAGYMTVSYGLVIAVGAMGLAIPVGSRLILLVGPIALLSIPVLIVYSTRKARV